jgi:hypothetical protein
LCLLSYIYLEKYIKIKIPWKDIFKLVIAGFLSIFVVYTLSTQTENLMIDFILGALGGIIYLLILVPLRFYKSEDVNILNIVAEKFPKFKKEIDLIIKIFLR